MTNRLPPIHGHAEPTFGPVAEAFEENFARREELGAALAIWHRGRKVVDLWGGIRDRASGAPWEEDTMVPVFSTGKGLAAMTVAHAVSTGRLSFDDPVSAHWPAFAAGGKAEITVADILSHRSGLALFGRAVDRTDLADPDRMAAILADMAPVWRPGEAWGYHLATFGPLVGEIVRRTDPARRSLGEVFRDAFAAPLGLSFHFGLPDSVPDRRVARIVLSTAGQIAWGLSHAPFPLARKAFNPLSLLHAAIREIRDIGLNDRGWMRNEFPSANGVGEVRAIARLYAGLAAGGGEIDIAPSVRAALPGAPAVPPAGRRDRVMGVKNLWHLGFVRPTADFPFSPSPRAFGMPGLGGSFGFADPDRGIGYAYAPNRLGLLPFDDRRDRALRRALDRVLAGLEAAQPVRATAS